MVEMFEGQCVDWDKFTAEDAVKYTKEGQKHLQEKEYIDIIKEIAYVAKLGQSKITFSKELTDYTISRLEANGFDVSCKPIECYTTISNIDSKEIVKVPCKTTTIEW